MNKSNVVSLHPHDAIAPVEDRIAASPARAELLRLQSDLEPVSAQLSVDLAALFDMDSTAAHCQATRSRRAAHAPRRWRALAAIAAVLVAAIAVWGVRHVGVAPTQTASATNAPDRIFAGFDERNVAASKPTAHDEIFRGNFLPDEIFSSSKGHEG